VRRGKLANRPGGSEAARHGLHELEVIAMSKGQDRKKEDKKKPAKTPKEKRAEKAAKRATRGY
jgi:hypothetical protein